jgi:hypothetical protein
MLKLLKTVDFTVSSSTKDSTFDTHRYARTNPDQVAVEGVVRIRVHHDSSYRFQSSAVFELWTSAGWTEVCRVLPTDVDNKNISTPVKAGTTEERLIKTASILLGWA